MTRAAEAPIAAASTYPTNS
jgi:hypothetical protein